MSRGGKKILIVGSSVLISLSLHALLPAPDPLSEHELSWIVNTISFLPTVTLYFMVAYFIIATVYLKYESRLPGSKIVRALMFGSLVGGIWWVGMIEGVFVFGTLLLDEFIMGFLDFIPIVIMCMLLGVFLGKDTNGQAAPARGWKNVFTDLGIFVFIFSTGRVCRYMIQTGGYNQGELIMITIWTICFALIISLNFIYFKQVTAISSLVKSTLHFTLLLFGLHYFLFVYFVPLIFQGMFIDLTVILIYDLLLVFFAGLTCYRFNSRISSGVR